MDVVLFCIVGWLSISLRCAIDGAESESRRSGFLGRELGDRRFVSADFAAENLREGVIDGNERRQRVSVGRVRCRRWC